MMICQYFKTFLYLVIQKTMMSHENLSGFKIEKQLGTTREQRVELAEIEIIKRLLKEIWSDFERPQKNFYNRRINFNIIL